MSDTNMSGSLTPEQKLREYQLKEKSPSAYHAKLIYVEFHDNQKTSLDLKHFDLNTFNRW